MIFSRTSLFLRSYEKLTTQEQGRIKKALKKLAKNPYYPFPRGLRVHKLAGVLGTAVNDDEQRPPVWEFHATGSLLITFQYGINELMLRNCGEHDAVLRSPQAANISPESLSETGWKRRYRTPAHSPDFPLTRGNLLANCTTTHGKTQRYSAMERTFRPSFLAKTMASIETRRTAKPSPASATPPSTAW